MNEMSNYRFPEDRLLSLDFFRGITMFVVIGINAIFIYPFSNTVGGQWLNGCVTIFTNGFLAWLKTPEFIINLITALSVLTLEWLLCYYLFVKRILFRI